MIPRVPVPSLVLIGPHHPHMVVSPLEIIQIEASRRENRKNVENSNGSSCPKPLHTEKMHPAC